MQKFDASSWASLAVDFNHHIQSYQTAASGVASASMFF